MNFLLSVFLLVFLLISSTSILAGNIPGVPAPQPPDLQADLHLQISNDFFSLLNNQDDYRTQQVSVTGFLSDNWLFVYDQSILTVQGQTKNITDLPGTEGRLDQQSFSLGYRAYYESSPGTIVQLLSGIGFRKYGNYDGARIQNGIHRFFNETPVNLPYIDHRGTDLVAWLRGSKQEYLQAQTNDLHWQLGYWLDGSILFTSDGQIDGTLGVFGVIHYNNWEFWTGPRGDWRNGYDTDVVQRQTAEHEQGISWVIGLAYGPVRLETNQGLGNNKSGFGGLVFSAENKPDLAPEINSSHWSYQVALLTPEIGIQNQIRWSPENWRMANDIAWSLVGDYRYSTAARDDTGNQYTISKQYLLGVEARFAGRNRDEWLQPYIMIGAGYRSEYIDGEGDLAELESDTVESLSFTTDAGVRLLMSGKKDKWRVQLVLGLTGWFPVDSKNVEFNAEKIELLESNVSWLAGLNTSFTY